MRHNSYSFVYTLAEGIIIFLTKVVTHTPLSIVYVFLVTFLLPVMI